MHGHIFGLSAPINMSVLTALLYYLNSVSFIASFEVKQYNSPQLCSFSKFLGHCGSFPFPFSHKFQNLLTNFYLSEELFISSSLFKKFLKIVVKIYNIVFIILIICNVEFSGINYIHNAVYVCTHHSCLCKNPVVIANINSIPIK